MTQPVRERGPGPAGLRASAAWTWRILVVAAGIYLLLRLLAEFKVLVVPVLVALLLVALIRPLAELRRPPARPGAPPGVDPHAVVRPARALGARHPRRPAGGHGLPRPAAAVGPRTADVRTWLANGPLHVTGAQIDTYIEQAQASISANSSRLLTGALGVASTAVDVGSGVFIALFSIFFFLSTGDRIWAFVVSLFPRGARPRVEGAAVHAWATLTAYVRATVIVAAVDAIGIGLGAAILGVPLAVPIAVLVFLGAFVPIVGALVTGIVAVLVALVSQGFVVAVIMLGVVIAVQQVEAHVLQPFLLGRAVEVHPLAVVLSIGAGVLVAGIVGALFAVPLVAVGHVVSVYLRDGDGGPDQNAPPGDRPPETPREDADDAAQQAGPLADAPLPDPARALRD